MPLALIEAIGSAPLPLNPRAPDSRFQALEAWLAARSAGRDPARRRRLAARLTDPRRRNALTLTLRSEGLDGFENWLALHLPEIHARWRDAQGPES